jgi:MinD-like ATPase involved in chromosome partitioning or flagellar assembly
VTKVVAFHSYKGGTGKSTLSANLSALMAKRGFSVFLLDMDLYAPSLHAYFDVKPEKWINDFLFENAELDDIAFDRTEFIDKFYHNASFKLKGGKIVTAFSNSSRDEVYKIDGTTRNEISKMQLLRRFILLRENIVSTYNPDFIIIDTSPGIRYWSINSLVIAEVIILSLKSDAIDIKGTHVLSDEIYKNFTKLGTKSYLLLNRVAGYCNPPNEVTFSKEKKLESNSNESYISEVIKMQENAMLNLKMELGMDIISSIPCYCDIQFDNDEFLTVLKSPNHPFTSNLNELINRLENI